MPHALPIMPSASDLSVDWILRVRWIIYCRSGCSILNRHHNCCYQAIALKTPDGAGSEWKSGPSRAATSVQTESEL